jgi:hypothetical protein
MYRVSYYTRSKGMKNRECERMTASLAMADLDNKDGRKQSHKPKKIKVFRERWDFSNPDKNGNYRTLKVEKF